MIKPDRPKTFDYMVRFSAKWTQSKLKEKKTLLVKDILFFNFDHVPFATIGGKTSQLYQHVFGLNFHFSLPGRSYTFFSALLTSSPGLFLARVLPFPFTLCPLTI